MPCCPSENVDQSYHRRGLLKPVAQHDELETWISVTSAYSRADENHGCHQPRLEDDSRSEDGRGGCGIKQDDPILQGL